MASTGSSLDADIAGIIPEINPITAANPEPNNILAALKTNSKSNTEDKIKATYQTKTVS